MSQHALSELVASAAEKFGVPGAAVGVWHGGEAHLACRGVTSLASPQPADPRSAFNLGSVREPGQLQVGLAGA